MKRTRNVIAIALALLMSIGCFIINASAVGTPSGNESMQVIVKTSYATVHKGDIITVTLNIKNNYNAMSMRFPVLFSSGVFEVVDADFNLQKLGQLNSVSGSIGANTTGNPAFYPAGYSSADYGALLMQWVGNTSAGVFGCYNQPSGQDCISFRLRVKTDAAGEGTIFIPSESNLFYRQAMNDPADGNTVYTMTAAACPMTFTSASVTVNPIDPDITAKQGSQTVIDKQHNYIYGLDKNLTSLNDYIEAVGGASWVLEKSSENICGTGTLVKVICNDSVVKTYTVIIFGDVNGDGNIDATDTDVCVNVQNWKTKWDHTTEAYKYFAGDINKDNNIDTIDGDIIIETMNWLSMGINQVTGKAFVYEAQ